VRLSLQQRYAPRDRSHCTPWLATAANIAPVAVVLLAFQIWDRSLGGAVTVLLVLVSMTSLLRYFLYVELTADGLDIHCFRSTHVPWQHIGSVDQVDGFGTAELKIYDRGANIGRRLPAPRATFGVGKGETAQARDLIERWWLAYIGTPLPAATRGASPYPPPGEALDPYRPPVEG
jgi:hypothetical protein